MKIKEAAAWTGVLAETIRSYEQIGLVRPPAGAGTGYRDYDEIDPREFGNKFFDVPVAGHLMNTCYLNSPFVNQNQLINKCRVNTES